MTLPGGNTKEYPCLNPSPSSIKGKTKNLNGLLEMERGGFYSSPSPCTTRTMTPSSTPFASSKKHLTALNVGSRKMMPPLLH